MAADKKNEIQETPEKKPVSVLEKINILSRLGFEMNASKKRIATAGVVYAFVLFTFIPSLLMLFSIGMTNGWLEGTKKDLALEAKHELKFNSQVFIPITENEKKISKENDNDQDNVTKVDPEDEDEKAKKFYKPKNDFEARVYTQLNLIKERMRLHLKVLLMFYRIYFVSIYMTMILGILSGISLLFISKDGWGNTGKSHQLLLTFFLVSSSAGIVYGTGPVIFEHAKNIELNKKYFKKLAAVRQNVFTFTSTGEMSYLRSQEGKEEEESTRIDGKYKVIITKLPQFIQYLDDKLKALHRYPVDFNPDASRSENQIAEDINKSMGGG